MHCSSLLAKKSRDLCYKLPSSYNSSGFHVLFPNRIPSFNSTHFRPSLSIAAPKSTPKNPALPPPAPVSAAATSSFPRVSAPEVEHAWGNARFRGCPLFPIQRGALSHDVGVTFRE
eukprot:GHVT01032989.1.p1 GENE.GHVT01032989.1~~GHVT01032989.1.p1  ORF type:complete len:116 (+),score=13.72 GHVT01032989.1:206-553(+)